MFVDRLGVGPGVFGKKNALESYISTVFVPSNSGWLRLVCFLHMKSRSIQEYHAHVGGGCNDVFQCAFLLWELIQFDEHSFQIG